MRRLAFFPVCIFFLTGLSWWSLHLEIAPARLVTLQPDHETRRRELVEWMDRFVAHQLVFREVNGHFSRLPSRVGLPLPPKLNEIYEIQVAEAGPDRLRIVAVSAGDSEAEERVTIDEGFALRANFPLPEPRPGYLRFIALKTLKALRAGGEAASTREKTAFRNYFRYERKTDSQERVVARAWGMQEPMIGEKFELGPEGLVPENEPQILAEAFPGAPQLDQEALQSAQHFSRKVFETELGREPESPEELAVFMGARPQPYGLVTREASPEPQIEALQTPLEAPGRSPASAVATVSNSSKTLGNFRLRGLEIESIPEDN